MLSTISEKFLEFATNNWYNRPQQTEEKLITFLKIEKIEYRVVIKFFVLECSIAIEIHTKMVTVLTKSAPTFPTVCRRVLEFQRARTGVEDKPSSGRSKIDQHQKTSM